MPRDFDTQIHRDIQMEVVGDMGVWLAADREVAIEVS